MNKVREGDNPGLVLSCSFAAVAPNKRRLDLPRQNPYSIHAQLQTTCLCLPIQQIRASCLPWVAVGPVLDFLLSAVINRSLQSSSCPPTATTSKAASRTSFRALHKLKNNVPSPRSQSVLRFLDRPIFRTA